MDGDADGVEGSMEEFGRVSSDDSDLLGFFFIADPSRGWFKLEDDRPWSCLGLVEGGGVSDDSDGNLNHIGDCDARKVMMITRGMVIDLVDAIPDGLLVDHSCYKGQSLMEDAARVERQWPVVKSLSSRGPDVVVGGEDAVVATVVLGDVKTHRRWG